MARYPGTQWHKPPTTFPEMTATVWNVCPQRTGSITEAIVVPVHRSEHDRTQVHCPRCDGVLRAQEHTSIFDYRKEGLCTDDHLGIAWVTTAAQSPLSPSTSSG